MIFIMMEAVGAIAPVKAYTDRQKCLDAVAEANARHKHELAQSMISTCGYTLPEAEAYVSRFPDQHYMEEVELE